MNRVIRSAASSAAPVLMDTSARFVDGELAELIEGIRAEAYAAGRRDGDAAARADLGTVTGRVEHALREAARAAAQLRHEVITEALEAGFAVAEYVTGRGPGTESAVLGARIQEALDSLDDETVGISVNPQDWDQVGAFVDLLPGMTIDRDPTLRPGEARIRGTWSSIDLTRAAALEIAREVLS